MDFQVRKTQRLARGLRAGWKKVARKGQLECRRAAARATLGATCRPLPAPSCAADNL